jgi:hypothetical protein
MNHETLHAEYKEKSVKGRHINLRTITPLLDVWKINFDCAIAGSSVQDRPIYKCQLGHGKIKILMWSQMHGNESTTTKGLIDFMNMLAVPTAISNEILEKYSFCIIPILNPDGAEVYTRTNANGIDLNRDFQNLTQPESQLLMRCFTDFQPDYCYNLHDQRTIFGAGATGKPATISFLAPAFNDTKDYDTARLQAVQSIMRMVQVLNTYISGQIGRFDDGFNINCVGDAFQSLKTPTVLIEAGHFPDDYEREQTRKYIFIALLAAFSSHSENDVATDELSLYLQIPQNTPNFFDIVYKNVTIYYEDSDLITNFAVQFKEELIEDKIFFNAFVAKVGNLQKCYGHIEYDASEGRYADRYGTMPKVGELASFSINNEVKFVNGLVKK